MTLRHPLFQIFAKIDHASIPKRGWVRIVRQPGSNRYRSGVFVVWQNCGRREYALPLDDVAEFVARKIQVLEASSSIVPAEMARRRGRRGPGIRQRKVEE